MEPEVRPMPPASEGDRQRMVDLLCRQVVNDTLSIEEFERRIDRVHGSSDVADLDSVSADLPALPIPAPVAGATLAASVTRRPHQTVVAIMGGVSRRGGWTPAQRTTTFAFMGGAELDFREARLPPGVTEMMAVAIWGGVHVIVPPGLAVESNGIAILGGFEQAAESGSETSGAAVLRLNGLAVMGGVSVEVRLPGETGRDARRRRRENDRQAQRRPGQPTLSP